MNRALLYAFRIAFAVALSAVTWLAVTTLDLPGVTTGWDKGNHFIGFLVLAFLLDYSFPDRVRHRYFPDWLKWTFLMAYGIGIEYLQRYLGSRMFEYADMFADGVGIAGYLAARPLTARIPLLRELRGDSPLV